MKLTIRRIPVNKENHITLPQSLVNEWESIPQRLILQIGKWNYEVEVEIQGDLNDHSIGIPTTFKLPFDFPLHLPFEIKRKGKILHIGPIIAILAFPVHQDVTPDTLKKFKDYFASYTQINGLIYICAADSIDSSKKSIEGYFLDHHSGEDDPSWKLGIFPFPDTIYCKIEPRALTDIRSFASVSENIFNNHLIDKWDLWNLFSRNTHIKDHLPYTERFRSYHGLVEMLNKYLAVYIKPLETGIKKNLYKIDKTSERYRIVDKLGAEKCFCSYEDLNEILDVFLWDEPYLVQQAISFKRYEDRYYKFSVIMQKNGSKQWKCPFILTHFSETSGISANYSRSGLVIPGRETLRNIYRMNEREVFLKEQEMIYLCTSVCKTLEQNGWQYAELCIDIVLDENLKVWIIEITNQVEHELLFHSDRQLYLKVVTAPLEFAKYMAGFS